MTDQMAKNPRCLLLLRFLCAAAVAFCARLPAPVFAIRKSVDEALKKGKCSWVKSNVGSIRGVHAFFVKNAHFCHVVESIKGKDIGFAAPIMCRRTVQGRHLISDDNGYVCSALSIDPWSLCCPRTGERFSCQGCKLDLQCCNSYEYCVSCCLNPLRTMERNVLNLKVAKPATAGTYTNVFDFCMGRCRHSSASVVHENAYASDFHHCFLVQQNSSGSTGSNYGSRLAGINVIVGWQGESCSSVCRAKGQSCVPSRLSTLNKCQIMQKYMRCKSGCFRSIGPDQPAEVVDEAPTNLNPGACLYMQIDARLKCDGSHQHTKRLCPCA